MKVCTKCQNKKDISCFPKEKRNVDALGSWCKACKNEQGRTNNYASIWAQENPDRSKALKSGYVANNAEAVKESKTKWAKANSKKVLAKTRKYQAAKINATPSWLTKEQVHEMELMYINCPKGFHVDHIIPLQGREVKGLHVPWNLQYLQASDNFRKSNKVA